MTKRMEEEHGIVSTGDPECLFGLEMRSFGSFCEQQIELHTAGQSPLLLSDQYHDIAMRGITADSVNESGYRIDVTGWSDVQILEMVFRVGNPVNKDPYRLTPIDFRKEEMPLDEEN